MFKGVFPAIITPFKEDFSLDEEGLRRNIEFLSNAGVAGIVPCGTTGDVNSFRQQDGGHGSRNPLRSV